MPHRFNRWSAVIHHRAALQIAFNSALTRRAVSPRHVFALPKKYSTIDLALSSPYVSLIVSRPRIARRYGHSAEPYRRPVVGNLARDSRKAARSYSVSHESFSCVCWVNQSARIASCSPACGSQNCSHSVAVCAQPQSSTVHPSELRTRSCRLPLSSFKVSLPPTCRRNRLPGKVAAPTSAQSTRPR